MRRSPPIAIREPMAVGPGESGFSKPPAGPARMASPGLRGGPEGFSMSAWERALDAG